MSIIVIETSYEEGDAHKRITIKSFIDVFNALRQRCVDDDIDPKFLNEIVSRMPSLSKMVISKLRAKFDHYIEAVKCSEPQEARIWLKEIASMDESISAGIKKRCLEWFDDIGGIADVQYVACCKNPDGESVVKVVYKTEFSPSSERNEYDDETQIRGTWSQALRSAAHAMEASQWLAGALDVRHVDELTK